jgi:hypothetical protein
VSDTVYRRIVGYLDYARVGSGILRWHFNVELDSALDAPQDPRLLAFLDYVRERQAAEIAARGPGAIFL